MALESFHTKVINMSWARYVTESFLEVWFNTRQSTVSTRKQLLEIMCPSNQHASELTTTPGQKPCGIVKDPPKILTDEEQILKHFLENLP